MSEGSSGSAHIGTSRRDTSSEKVVSRKGDRFTIESVLCGDGSTLHGVTLQKSRIYASSSIDGGRECYHMIDPGSLVLSMRGATRGGNWGARPLAHLINPTISPTPIIRIPQNRRHHHFYKQKKLRDAVVAWCLENPGIALSVGGPQNRSPISGVAQYLVLDHGQILEQKHDKNDGNCMEAAIINAIDIVLGREAALQLRKYVDKYVPHLVKIKEIPKLFQQARVAAEAQKFRVTPEFLCNPFSVLVNAETGVFIVHLRQEKVVEHVVVVDASRGLIFDNAEKYPMRLSERALRSCGGSDATELEIANVRKIVDQRKSHKAGSSSK